MSTPSGSPPLSTSHPSIVARLLRCVRVFIAAGLIIAVILGCFMLGRRAVIESARRTLAAQSESTQQVPEHDRPPETLDRDLQRVLVLDGGGIRGIITLEVLAALEEASGRPTAELFDVFVGTSTGGIIAILLTLPDEHGDPRYTARELLDFYTRIGAEFFEVSRTHAFFTLRGLLGPKFPRLGVRDLLVNEIGDAHMADLLKPVLVASYADTERMPFFFWSRHMHSGLVAGSDEYLVADAIIASTTAVPMFMPTNVASTDGKRYGLFLDAGMFAPNPTIAGVVGAGHMYPGKRIYLVSLGTGASTPTLDVAQASGWGLLQWLPNLFPTMSKANTLFQEVFARIDALPNGEPLCTRFRRIDRSYGGGFASVFDASPESVAALVAFGEKLASDYASEIDEIARDLTEIGESTGDIATRFARSGEPASGSN